MRILVRGVNWLGDAVMALPALTRLRQAKSEAHITVWLPEKFADLFRGHPAFDETWSFTSSTTLAQTAHRFREGHYDWAVVLPNSPRSALEVWLAGIPNRLGYSQAWRNLFLNHRWPTAAGGISTHKRSLRSIQRAIRAPAGSFPAVSHAEHHLQHYLRLVTALGADPTPLAPELHIGDAEVSTVCSKFGLERALASGRPLIGINPGAEYGPAKRWMWDRFVETAVEVQRQKPVAWVILGGPADAPAANRMAQQIQSQTLASPGAAPAGDGTSVISVAGRTSIRELAALLQGCRVLLTNDTGPMHIAAAVKTRVVALFGSTSPELTGPGQPGDPKHRLIRTPTPCAPCFRRACPIDFRCMTGITVPQVVAPILEILAG